MYGRLDTRVFSVTVNLSCSQAARPIVCKLSSCASWHLTVLFRSLALLTFSGNLAPQYSPGPYKDEGGSSTSRLSFHVNNPSVVSSSSSTRTLSNLVPACYEYDSRSLAR